MGGSALTQVPTTTAMKTGTMAAEAIQSRKVREWLGVGLCIEGSG